jgi:nitrile hydratase
MEGVHDMGGMHGYGEIPGERDNEPFHAEWEPIGYGSSMVAVMQGHFCADAIRYAIERIPARDYLAMPYFERVIVGVASLYVEKGLISKEELERHSGGIFPLARQVVAGETVKYAGPGFGIGDHVSVRQLSTSGHSRAPRYVQGKSGVVVGISPPAHFAGHAAQGKLDDTGLEPTYQVRFEASDLWPEVRDGSTVVVDLFQSYLHPADIQD